MVTIIILSVLAAAALLRQQQNVVTALQAPSSTTIAPQNIAALTIPSDPIAPQTAALPVANSSNTSTLFSTRVDSGSFLENQMPQVQYPFIPNKMVTNVVPQTATLTQPQERGTWFTPRVQSSRMVVQK
jgi:hypothetical protein